MATIAQVHIKTEQGTYIYSYLGKDFVHVMNNLERERREATPLFACMGFYINNRFTIITPDLFISCCCSCLAKPEQMGCEKCDLKSCRHDLTSNCVIQNGL